MNKANKFSNKIIIFILICMLAGCIIGCGKGQKNKEYTNIFEYMFSLEDEANMYVPQGLTFGMGKEDVIKAKALTDYTENAFEEYITEKTVTDVSEGIGELNVRTYYCFSGGYGLSSVTYEFRMAQEDVDAFLEIVKANAEEYMPTGIEDASNRVVWGEKVAFEMATDLSNTPVTREVCKSYASFEGVLSDAENENGCVVQFKVGAGDSYWTYYNLFYDNFFHYAIKLDSEEHTFDLNSRKVIYDLRYGDDIQSIIFAYEAFYPRIEQEKNHISMSLAFMNMPKKITEYVFTKDFTFDDESKLYGVEYTLSVKEEEFETLCQVLCEQAENYMPKATEGEMKDIENGKDVSWSAKDANGKTTSHVELTFADAEDGRKEVTLGIHIEEQK